MFTSHMTEDELQAVAYRDFLEIRMKVKIAFEQFIIEKYLACRFY